MRTWMMAGVTALTLIGMADVASAVTAPDSKLMERAKEFFADEQWVRAIAEFQAVATDPREANRDEALFWLAQSEFETLDYSNAIQTLARLERQFPASRWVRWPSQICRPRFSPSMRYALLESDIKPPSSAEDVRKYCRESVHW